MEDRDTEGFTVALVRPLDRGLVEVRAEQESLVQAKAKAKTENKVKRQEQQKTLDEKAETSLLQMCRTAELPSKMEMGFL